MQEMVGNKIFSIMLKLMHFKEKGQKYGQKGFNNSEPICSNAS